MEAVVVGPPEQLADLAQLAGSARTAALPAVMRRRSRPALANRHLTSFATDHRKTVLSLPLRKAVGEVFVPVSEISIAVPAHPNENADEEHQHQIKRDFLFGVHPYVPEKRSRIATATMPRTAEPRRQIFVAVIAPPPVTSA
jgi:hypothetical protein